MPSPNYAAHKRVRHRLIVYARAGPEPPNEVRQRSKCQLSQGPPP
jgi:hypothetical protein